MSILKHKKLMFPALLLLGFAAYLVLFYAEERPYTGPVAEVRGIVQKTEYVYGGTLTGRSFTRVYLEDGKIFRLPIGQMVGAQQGDEIVMFVPQGTESEHRKDTQVVSYQIRHKEKYPMPKATAQLPRSPSPAVEHR